MRQCVRAPLFVVLADCPTVCATISCACLERSTNESTITINVLLLIIIMITWSLLAEIYTIRYLPPRLKICMPRPSAAEKLSNAIITTKRQKLAHKNNSSVPAYDLMQPRVLFFFFFFFFFPGQWKDASTKSECAIAEPIAYPSHRGSCQSLDVDPNQVLIQKCTLPPELINLNMIVIRTDSVS